MTLTERLAAMRANPPYTISDAMREAMQASVDRLRAEGVAERMLQAGDRAPDFELPAQDGNVRAMHAALAAGPLVLSFYRGIWCPFCNEELKTWAEVGGRIRGAGAQIFAVSPQGPSNSRKAARDFGLDFPLLHDRGNALARRFGLVFRVDPDVETAYRSLGIDLQRFNGDDSWELPIPGRFVIDTGGRIVFAEADPDYRRRPEPDAMLAALEALVPA